jgi:phosphoribosyl 1,2-cyclic phosphodiesterase
MILTVLGSNSRGNGYVIQDADQALIIEAGVSLTKVKQALGFNISKVKGVLISHEHGDHAKYSREYEKLFKVYTSTCVKEHWKLKSSITIAPEKGFKVGSFKVLPLAASHDVPCMSFHISHERFGNLLFVTDTFLFEYSFNNLNHVLMECNYIDSVINVNVENNIVHPKVRDRVLTSHMELQTTIRALKYQDLCDVNTILLIHLSEQNSDPSLMKEAVQGAVSRPVEIAKPGVHISLSVSPY